MSPFCCVPASVSRHCHCTLCNSQPCSCKSRFVAATATGFFRPHCQVHVTEKLACQLLGLQDLAVDNPVFLSSVPALAAAAGCGIRCFQLSLCQIQMTETLGCRQLGPRNMAINNPVALSSASHLHLLQPHPVLSAAAVLDTDDRETGLSTARSTGLGF